MTRRSVEPRRGYRGQALLPQTLPPQTFVPAGAVLNVQHPPAQPPLQCWRDLSVTDCLASGTNCHTRCIASVTQPIRLSDQLLLKS
ncbi:Hypothetical protein PSEBR_m1560 [Pseudomonas brassicacearum subsp. brassicacearum NFM421]|uniref:Uncharacterized protein n=1 Tax=Pseudomonas brassicacearum (strain NFM421) TaxID=994484 RepID=F2KLL3_PSEBN|nr:Hypothetical protein PSEBR_m1560 [Pseudomonas brassicacearum subsp. brassicacearum NFM421]